MLKPEVVFYQALLPQLRECLDYYFMVLSVEYFSFVEMSHYATAAIDNSNILFSV